MSARERRERERREREREIELRNRKRAAREIRQRALRMSKSYVAFLTMAVMVFGIFTGAYIHIQSEMTARMNQISSLESQIADLKADNDEAYKRINTSVDLDEHPEYGDDRIWYVLCEGIADCVLYSER